MKDWNTSHFGRIYEQQPGSNFLHLKDALEETCHDSVQCGSSELGSYIADFREVVLAMDPVCNRRVSNILPKNFIVITWF